MIEIIVSAKHSSKKSTGEFSYKIFKDDQYLVKKLKTTKTTRTRLMLISLINSIGVAVQLSDDKKLKIYHSDQTFIDKLIHNRFKDKNMDLLILLTQLLKVYEDVDIEHISKLDSELLNKVNKEFKEIEAESESVVDKVYEVGGTND